MMDRMRSLLKNSNVIKYVCVGGGVYALEVVIIIVAQRLGATPVTAVALSFLIGLVVSFILQKFITFGDKRTHHKILVSQVIAVCLLVVFNFGFTVLTTKLLEDLMPAVVIRTLTLGVTTVWNFYLYKTHIFKDDKLASI